MRTFFRQFLKIIPTFLTAIALAVAVWVSAVTASDPIQENLYPFPVKVETIGQDSSLILVSNLPSTISVTLKAPQSTWSSLNNDRNAVRAVVDLSGLSAGTHTANIQIQVNTRPVQVSSYSPDQLEIVLDQMAMKTLPVTLIQRGETAIGFQAGDPILSQSEVTINGPKTAIDKVNQIRAILDISLARENINRSLTLSALDAQENIISGITITPQQITVSEMITQRYGYRNVVVKVTVSGQIGEGYRLTNISVSPPAVTVFSSDPKIVDQLPGYVETLPIDLTGATDDLDLFQPLNLPAGVEVVGDQTTVYVQVSIAAIEGSLPYSTTIDFIGLTPGFEVKISPETVTAILSGPLPRLDQLNSETIRITVDLTGLEIGTYQLTPVIELAAEDIQVQSILPQTVEVVITRARTPTRTPQP